MHQTLRTIAKNWRFLSPDSMYQIWHLCRKHRLDPEKDVRVYKRRGSDTWQLRLSTEKLKSYLESRGRIIIHRELHDETQRKVQVAITTRESKSIISFTAKQLFSDERMNDIASRAWYNLLHRFYRPLHVDLERGEIYCEPELNDTESRSQAPREKKSKSLELVRREAMERDRFIKHLNADEIENGKIYNYLSNKSPDIISDTKVLVEAMWQYGYLADGDDVDWAIESLLVCLFKTAREYTCADSAESRRIATALIIRVMMFGGTSPVTAIGDPEPLRMYLEKGLERYAKMALTLRPIPTTSIPYDSPYRCGVQKSRSDQGPMDRANARTHFLWPQVPMRSFVTGTSGHRPPVQQVWPRYCDGNTVLRECVTSFPPDRTAMIMQVFGAGERKAIYGEDRNVAVRNRCTHLCQCRYELQIAARLFALSPVPKPMIERPYSPSATALVAQFRGPLERHGFEDTAVQRSPRHAPNA